MTGVQPYFSPCGELPSSKQQPNQLSFPHGLLQTEHFTGKRKRKSEGTRLQPDARPPFFLLPMPQAASVPSAARASGGWDSEEALPSLHGGLPHVLHLISNISPSLPGLPLIHCSSPQPEITAFIGVTCFPLWNVRSRGAETRSPLSLSPLPLMHSKPRSEFPEKQNKWASLTEFL